jgi:trimethylamine--corrinoid protein Co-methyltransferase
MDKAPRSYLLIPEQIIFDDEIYHSHRILTQGLNINLNGLTLDIIKQVGPGGHFLAQKHTRSNLRERWIPRLTNPQSVNGDGPADIQMRARAELDRILDEHQPEPLDKTVQNELVSILEAADSEFIH